MLNCDFLPSLMLIAKSSSWGCKFLRVRTSPLRRTARGTQCSEDGPRRPTPKRPCLKSATGYAFHWFVGLNLDLVVYVTRCIGLCSIVFLLITHCPALYVCIDGWMDVCMCECMYVCMYAFMCWWMHVFVCMCGYMCVCMYVCMYACIRELV